MPPLKNFTTKAKEALRRAHELAIERGQNHVNPVHLLCALILQEESMVTSILEKLEIDTMLLTDSILESIEGTEGGSSTLSNTKHFGGNDGGHGGRGGGGRDGGAARGWVLHGGLSAAQRPRRRLAAPALRPGRHW